jgi:hypothetical protein
MNARFQLIEGQPVSSKPADQLTLSETDDRASVPNNAATEITGTHAPTISETAFPSLTPLVAYEHQFGHHAAQGCFLQTVSARHVTTDATDDCYRGLLAGWTIEGSA